MKVAQFLVTWVLMVRWVKALHQHAYSFTVFCVGRAYGGRGGCRRSWSDWWSISVVSVGLASTIDRFAHFDNVDSRAPRDDKKSRPVPSTTCFPLPSRPIPSHHLSPSLFLSWYS